MQEIDTSNGVIFPFYDQDTNMVYLCGKVRTYQSINQSVCKFVYLWFLWSGEVRESWGKIRGSGKVREFYIPKSGKT